MVGAKVMSEPLDPFSSLTHLFSFLPRLGHFSFVVPPNQICECLCEKDVCPVTLWVTFFWGGGADFGGVAEQKEVEVHHLPVRHSDIPGLLGKSWDLSKDVHVSSAGQQERPLNTVSGGEPTGTRMLRVPLQQPLIC